MMLGLVEFQPDFIVEGNLAGEFVIDDFLRPDGGYESLDRIGKILSSGRKRRAPKSK